MTSRRSFFKTMLGLGAGAASFSLSHSRRLRVGVLAPEGATHFVTTLEGQGWELTHAPTGPTQASALRQAGKLMSEEVEVLVSLGDGLGEVLLPLVEQHAIPLIACEFGVLMPRTSPGPLVFTNSLRQWQAEWALGEWSASHRGQTAVIVSSLKEAGYDLPYAFRSGFEAAGGKVLATLVSDATPKGHDFGAVLEQLRELRPDTVHLISDQEGLGLAHHLDNPTFGGSAVLNAHGYCASSVPAEDGLEVLARQARRWLEYARERQDGRGLLAALREAQKPQAPLYLCRIQGGKRHAITALTEPPQQHPALLSLLTHPRSGFTNLYGHG